MSFRLQAKRVRTLLALARAEDGLPPAAHPADMPMLATMGLVAVGYPDDGPGARAWRLTLAGRRAVEALTDAAPGRRRTGEHDGGTAVPRTVGGATRAR